VNFDKKKYSFKTDIVVNVMKYHCYIKMIVYERKRDKLNTFSYTTKWFENCIFFFSLLNSFRFKKEISNIGVFENRVKKTL
jgi:hypothetical protein